MKIRIERTINLNSIFSYFVDIISYLNLVKNNRTSLQQIENSQVVRNIEISNRLLEKIYVIFIKFYTDIQNVSCLGGVFAKNTSR